MPSKNVEEGFFVKPSSYFLYIPYRGLLGVMSVGWDQVQEILVAG